MKKLKQIKGNYHVSNETVKKPESTDVEVENSFEDYDKIAKGLKDLKEESIILRLKLDSLERETNMMDVEFSQVSG